MKPSKNLHTATLLDQMYTACRKLIVLVRDVPLVLKDPLTKQSDQTLRQLMAATPSYSS